MIGRSVSLTGTGFTGFRILGRLTGLFELELEFVLVPGNGKIPRPVPVPVVVPDVEPVLELELEPELELEFVLEPKRFPRPNPAEPVAELV